MTPPPKKLAALLEDFGPFEESILRSTREAHDHDMTLIKELGLELKEKEEKLEKVQSEDAAANVAFLKHCEAKIEEASNAFASLLDHQTRRAHERLDDLDRQTDLLCQHFLAEKERILKEREARTEHLSQLLHQFRGVFEREKTKRREREDQFKQEIETHREAVDRACSEEEQQRLDACDSIEKELSHVIASRKVGNDQLYKASVRHVDRLDKRLADLIKQRQTSDDNIFKAMNQYTEMLQTSLATINTP